MTWEAGKRAKCELPQTLGWGRLIWILAKIRCLMTATAQTFTFPTPALLGTGMFLCVLSYFGEVT